jgi:NADH:ubiquinone oxidoreductase subunit H
MLLIIILGTIYFILLDELIMGCAQRRIGPFNLGHYGLLSSLINGCNLIISQYLLPKVCLHFGFQSFPILFLIFSSHCSAMLYPFFLIDLYLSIILFILLSSASLLFIIFTAFSGCSKYSMLGCIRIISYSIIINIGS